MVTHERVSSEKVQRMFREFADVDDGNTWQDAIVHNYDLVKTKELKLILQ